LLNTAGVFAAGFLMRPIGGWVFGRLADRTGRRKALIISVLTMAIGSLGIAVLPTHASIGVWAPVCWWWRGWCRALRWAANMAPPPPI
jgi:MFS family permease